MNTRICSTCQKPLPLENFHKRGDNWQYMCKACKKTNDKKRYTDGNKKDIIEQRKQQIKETIDQYKRTKGCECCQESEPVCLDFHHTSNDKEFDVAEGVRRGFSIEKLMEEILKCRVVCANCHRKVHANIIAL